MLQVPIMPILPASGSVKSPQPVQPAQPATAAAPHSVVLPLLGSPTRHCKRAALGGSNRYHIEHHSDDL
jgi:hypothetical protein